MNSNDEFKKAFKAFAATDRSIGLHANWDEMVLLAALLLNCTSEFSTDERWSEMEEIRGGYSPERLDAFVKVLNAMGDAFERRPFQDLLGQTFMELELESKGSGQFFTPMSISKLCACLTIGEVPDYERVADPACGAGALLIAAAWRAQQLAQENGMSDWRWQDHLEFHCRDVEKQMALMCYVQLGILGACGEVQVGNTLSMDIREAWELPYVTAHKRAQMDAKSIYKLLEALTA